MTHIEGSIIDKHNLDAAKKEHPSRIIMENNGKYGTKKALVVLLTTDDLQAPNKELQSKYGLDRRDISRVKDRGYFRLNYNKSEINCSPESMERLVNLFGGYEKLTHFIYNQVRRYLRKSNDVKIEQVASETLIKVLEKSADIEGVGRNNIGATKKYISLTVLGTLKKLNNRNGQIYAHDFSNEVGHDLQPLQVAYDNTPLGDLIDTDSEYALRKLSPILSTFVKTSLFKDEKSAYATVSQQFNIKLSPTDKKLLKQVAIECGFFQSMEFIGNVILKILSNNPDAKIISSMGMSYYISIGDDIIRISDHESPRTYYTYDITPQSYAKIADICPYIK